MNLTKSALHYKQNAKVTPQLPYHSNSSIDAELTVINTAHAHCTMISLCGYAA